jgi:membrane protein insertase Oxa1/YidC/SpoIIIJ
VVEIEVGGLRIMSVAIKMWRLSQTSPVIILLWPIVVVVVVVGVSGLAPRSITKSS